MRDQPWKQAITIPHLQSFGFNPKVIWGVSGFALALRPSNPYCFDKNGNPEYIHPSQVGCCLSHIGALQAGVASGEEEFIVFEDDVQLVDGFAERWKTVRESIGNEIEVVQMEHLHADKHDTIELNPHLQHCFYPFGAAAIWWKREAAEKAIQLIHPIDMPYDIMLIRRVYPFVQHAIVSEPLVHQRTACGKWPSAIGEAMKMGANRFR